MRGGILDWRRATAILDALGRRRAMRTRGDRRRRRASRRFWPRIRACQRGVSPVAADRTPTRRPSATHYVRHGSLLSFRVAGADEERTRHFADVLATTRRRPLRAVVRRPGDQGQSPPDGVRVLHARRRNCKRNGFDRLIRLGVGLEDADDLIAALNWTLHHADTISPDDVAAWQRERIAEPRCAMNARGNTKPTKDTKITKVFEHVVHAFPQTRHSPTVSSLITQTFRVLRALRGLRVPVRDRSAA